VCVRHTMERTTHMARKPPIRTTKSVHLTLAAPIAEKLRAAAARLGYTESEYVSVLVNGQVPTARPGAEMQDVALAGNRIVRAIGALESEPDVPEAIRLLRDAQRSIATELMRAKPAMEQRISVVGSMSRTLDNGPSTATRSSKPLHYPFLHVIGNMAH